MFDIDFLLTSLLVVLIPGTGVIYTVSMGLFESKKAAIAASVGCTFGIVPHLLACISGLSLLLHTSALAFQAVKLAGAVYLLYMAWGMWRGSGKFEFTQQHSSGSAVQIAVRGTLINVLNPKLSLFFLAFLPLFVSSEGASPTIQLLGLSAVFMAITFVIFIGYGLFAHSVKTVIVSSPERMRNVQRVFAATFAALGAKLAMTE
ncbi:LysE family translocator [Halodesulfovibrio spirochaetisodalis]|uniref:Lysine transporter LysE n=1 Tax=Halodesulfovibrio spirochaetisodalis TaxID=1560234 RepID=A0A1B7XN11_9BACT|nr:LysE family translocator [Halodesulfovibrio spirochaetisodalis]OBQ56875.1 hypothetical protein SP90_02135 [Halodesulfovibrio spirochaetisodalis]